jgi:hypothetical protein
MCNEKQQQKAHTVLQKMVFLRNPDPMCACISDKERYVYSWPYVHQLAMYGIV